MKLSQGQVVHLDEMGPERSESQVVLCESTSELMAAPYFASGGRSVGVDSHLASSACRGGK